jgi:SAM-dependent methyltransferase
MDMKLLAALSESVIPTHGKVLQPHRFSPDDKEHVGALLSLLDPCPFSRVLDAGCGFGEVSRIMRQIRPDLDFVMVNMCEGQLAHAPRAPGMWPIVADCHNMPITSDSCDDAMMLMSLCNMDTRFALKEVSRILRSGGHLLVFDFARSGGDNIDCLELLGMHAFSHDVMEQLAFDAGLELNFVENPLCDDSKFRTFFRDEAVYRAIFRHLEPTLWRFTKL